MVTEEKNSKKMHTILNVANQITFSRILMTPVIVFLLHYPQSRFVSFLVTVIFVLVSITDLLDGYFARKGNTITPLGKFLDPVADKVLISSTLIMLVYIQRIPAWIAIVIIVRDVTVTGLRAVAAEGGYSVPVEILGKFKTVIQVIALSCILFYYPIFGVLKPYVIGMWFLYAATVLAVVSAAQYIYKYYRDIHA